MLISVFGKKIGMTQVFDSSGNVVPVTVIGIENLYVTQIKSKEKDGYSAVQLGLLKDKYLNEKISTDWLKNKKMYFSDMKEVVVDGDISEFKLCQKIDLSNLALQEGQNVAVTGRSKGLGFQGVVKRWNFGGGPKTHGSTFHRRPGAVGHMRTQGEVIKGKRLPGHKGDKQFTVEGLRLVKIDKDKNCLLVKGSVPGKGRSLVLVRRQGK